MAPSATRSLGNLHIGLVRAARPVVGHDQQDVAEGAVRARVRASSAVGDDLLEVALVVGNGTVEVARVVDGAAVDVIVAEIDDRDVTRAPDDVRVEPFRDLMGEIVGVARVRPPCRAAHGKIRQRGYLPILVEELLGPVVERPAFLPREAVAESGQLADGDVGIVQARGVRIRRVERTSLYRRPGQAGEGEGGHRGQRPQATYGEYRAPNA